MFPLLRLSSRRPPETSNSRRVAPPSPRTRLRPPVRLRWRYHRATWRYATALGGRLSASTRGTEESNGNSVRHRPPSGPSFRASLERSLCRKRMAIPHFSLLCLHFNANEAYNIRYNNITYNTVVRYIAMQEL